MLKKYWNYFFYIALVVPSSAYALGSIVPCTGLDCKLGDLLGMLKTIYNMMLGFSALVAMTLIIIGGVRMFYWSFMEDSESELKAARYTVSRAIVGLIIVAAAYFIVNTFIGMLGGGSFMDIYERGLPPAPNSVGEPQIDPGLV